MTATILDGRKFSAEIRAELKEEANLLKDKGVVPGLSGILIGEDPGSTAYVGLKSKACEEIGINEMMCRLPATISGQELFENIDRLNGDSKVHGIFIQLPLPEILSGIEAKTLAAISPQKDVDGFHAINVGRAWLGLPAFLPSVALAIQEMLLRCGYNLNYKQVVIVNVDNMVGKPLASILVQDSQKANVTLLQPETPDIDKYTRKADVLVVSVNKPNFITANMVKEGVVVLDFGGNWVSDPVTG